MKNKKLMVIGIIFATTMCVAVGCGCGNSEAVETVATIEAEEPETMEKVEETTEPSEEAPAVGESVEKEAETEKEVETEKEAETEKAVETSVTEDTTETTETDYMKEAEELWGLHSGEFECNYETFRENYTEEREGGADKEAAYETVYGILKKVEENVIEKDYEILPLDATTMYATQSCNIRKGPSTDYEKVGGLSYAESVTIIGKVETDEGKVWYVLESEDTEDIRMVSGSLLSSTKPQPSVQTNNDTTPSNTPNTQPQSDPVPSNTADPLAGLPGAGPGINWDTVHYGPLGDASSPFKDAGGWAE